MIMNMLIIITGTKTQLVLFLISNWIHPERKREPGLGLDDRVRLGLSTGFRVWAYQKG